VVHPWDALFGTGQTHQNGLSTAAELQERSKARDFYLSFESESTNLFIFGIKTNIAGIVLKHEQGQSEILRREDG
jgi:hypothetical protein